MPSMLDFPLMLWVKLPVVDRIYPESNKFVMGVDNKATGDSKINESPKQSPVNKILKLLYWLRLRSFSSSA